MRKNEPEKPNRIDALGVRGGQGFFWSTGVRVRGVVGTRVRCLYGVRVAAARRADRQGAGKGPAAGRKARRHAPLKGRNGLGPTII